MAALPRTIHDLEEQFAALAEHIPDTPEKQAISVLHGIMMEMWRNLRDGDGEPPYDGFPDSAELYRSAPPMEAAAINEPLAPGTPAPPFALRDPAGDVVRLEDFRGRPVVIVFYPLDWSPGCSQQLDLYQQELDEFRRRDAELVAISVDSLYSTGHGRPCAGSPSPSSPTSTRRATSHAPTRSGASPTASPSVRSTSSIRTAPSPPAT